MAYLWTHQNQRLYIMRPGAAPVAGVAGELAARRGLAVGASVAELAARASSRGAHEGAGLLHASRAARTAAAALGLLLLWSLSYLLRQQTWEAASPLFGDFMLEGAFLALAWLAALVTGCIALLSGAVVLRDPSTRV